MKKIFFLWLAIITAWMPLYGDESDMDYSHIDVEIPPFYLSEGPVVDVGRFSSGLASTKEEEILATIAKLKKDWNKLTFPELYVAAIRLYDLGYRKESVYWFHTARLRGRLFVKLADESKLGGIGSIAFELYHGHDAFAALIGDYINGYAFVDPDALMEIAKKIRKEGAEMPDLTASYPGVTFKKKSLWKKENEALLKGLDEMISTIKSERENIQRLRIENGTEAAFAKLENKELPD